MNNYWIISRLNQPVEALLVYDTQGKLVNTASITQAKQKIDLSELKAGLYLLQVAGTTNRLVLTE